MATNIPVPSTSLSRPESSITPLPEDLCDCFLLSGPHGKSYKHQYANIYFVRLTKLKPAVDQAARSKWANVAGNPVLIPRVLDVVKSQLCYVVGTVYMDMPLKPNVLEDIGKEHWIIAPPSRPKFNSSDDSIMLEDESGRIKLVGDKLKGLNIVTGVIMAALGVETASGEFKVVDVCFADMAPQPEILDSPDNMEVGKSNGTDESAPGEWIAFVSGLDIGADVDPSNSEQDDMAEMQLQLLVEFLTSETGGLDSQDASARISRLVIAGNSLVAPNRTLEDTKNSKRYNAQTTYNPTPLNTLTKALDELTSSISVHILPGSNDPAGATLPQQPMPAAMFGKHLASDSARFKSESNPVWLGLGGCGVLVSSGQPIDDIFKYVESEDRLAMARDTLQWRHLAPTCPDTLWCYPFFDTDPFILPYSPRIYVIGNQPEFQTDVVQGPPEGGKRQKTRILMLPRFSKTGEMVTIHTGTLEVKKFAFKLGGGWLATA